MRLIDADALTSYLDESVPDSDICISQYNADWIYSFIDSAPTIDPVVHGEWSDEIGDVHSAGKYRICSECGKNTFILWSSKQGLSSIDYDYCPNCGAKMDANNSTEQKM